MLIPNNIPPSYPIKRVEPSSPKDKASAEMLTALGLIGLSVAESKAQKRKRKAINMAANLASPVKSKKNSGKKKRQKNSGKKKTALPINPMRRDWYNSEISIKKNDKTLFQHGKNQTLIALLSIKYYHPENFAALKKRKFYPAIFEAVLLPFVEEQSISEQFTKSAFGVKLSRYLISEESTPKDPEVLEYIQNIVPNPEPVQVESQEEEKSEDPDQGISCHEIIYPEITYSRADVKKQTYRVQMFSNQIFQQQALIGVPEAHKNKPLQEHPESIKKILPSIFKES